jgi:hypothetical protein
MLQPPRVGCCDIKLSTYCDSSFLSAIEHIPCAAFVNIVCQTAHHATLLLYAGFPTEFTSAVVSGMFDANSETGAPTEAVGSEATWQHISLCCW